MSVCVCDSSWSYLLIRCARYKCYLLLLLLLLCLSTRSTMTRHASSACTTTKIRRVYPICRAPTAEQRSTTLKKVGLNELKMPTTTTTRTMMIKMIAIMNVVYLDIIICLSVRLSVFQPPCVYARTKNDRVCILDDPVVHVRVRWITETGKDPACTYG